MMNIAPIKTKAEHKQALVRVEVLWEAEPNTPEGDELDALVTLIEAFESKNYPIEAPNPIAAIKFRMEQQGLEDVDLVP
jgi:HTH-type transcriptional regulator/antitoxin HigA